MKPVRDPIAAQLAERTDFDFPRRVIGFAQTAVVVIGGIMVALTLVLGAHLLIKEAVGSGLIALLWSGAIAISTCLSYAILAGMIALFQIADDTRDGVMLESQRVRRDQPAA